MFSGGQRRLADLGFTPHAVTGTAQVLWQGYAKCTDLGGILKVLRQGIVADESTPEGLYKFSGRAFAAALTSGDSARSQAKLMSFENPMMIPFLLKQVYITKYRAELWGTLHALKQVYAPANCGIAPYFPRQGYATVAPISSEDSERAEAKLRQPLTSR